MRINLIARRVYVAPVLGLVLIAAMSACSSGSSSTSTPGSSASQVPSSTAASTPPPAPSSPAAASGGSSAAVTEITNNWNTFFNSSTPNSKRVQLLQNGSQFSASIAAFASSPLAAAVTSKVDSVTLDSATKATVKYDLSAMGTTVATGATGSSVLQDGTWKVGDDVFCGLLTEAKAAGMTVPVPSACSSAS
jgi:hypothetical protein